MSDQSVENAVPQYRIPENLVGFNTITGYLPVSIGLYNRFLPRDYFNSLFDRVKSLGPPEFDDADASTLYHNKLDNLKSIINYLIERYKQQVKEANILDTMDTSFLKHETHNIIDKLISSDELDDEAGPGRVPQTAQIDHADPRFPAPGPDEL